MFQRLHRMTYSLAAILCIFAFAAYENARAELFAYRFVDIVDTDRLFLRATHTYSLRENAEDILLYYRCEYNVDGIAQPQFHYTSRVVVGRLDPKTYSELMDHIRAYDWAALGTPGKNAAAKPVMRDNYFPHAWHVAYRWSAKFDGKRHEIEVGLDCEEHRQLHHRLLTSVDSVQSVTNYMVQPWSRDRVVEGDLEPPQSTSITELLKRPGHFYGKRVRVSGYHCSHFGGSRIAVDPQSVLEPTRSIYLGYPSWFAESAVCLDEVIPDVAFSDNELLIYPNNEAWVTIEGTYSQGEAHPGCEYGRIVRVTEMTVLSTE